MPTIKEIHYFNEKTSDPANIVLRLSRRLFGKRVVDRRWRRQGSDETALADVLERRLFVGP